MEIILLVFVILLAAAFIVTGVMWQSEIDYLKSQVATLMAEHLDRKLFPEIEPPKEKITEIEIMGKTLYKHKEVLPAEAKVIAAPHLDRRWIVKKR